MSDYKKEFDLACKKIVKLEEENKRLKEDLAFERTMLDNVKAEYDNLQNVIKKLKEELRYYKEKSEFQNKVIVKYQEENPMGFSDFGGYKD